MARSQQCLCRLLSASGRVTAAERSPFEPLPLGESFSRRAGQVELDHGAIDTIGSSAPDQPFALVAILPKGMLTSLTAWPSFSRAGLAEPSAK